MLKRLLSPFLLLLLILAGCQAPQGKFTPEQTAVMKSYGFTEVSGGWSLGLSDTILFDKNDYKLRPEGEKQIREVVSRLVATGLNHARLGGHTNSYGEDSYNEALSFKRANVVADVRARGANIPRTNLATQGLGKKYPIVNNQISKGRAENRRVVVVTATP